MRFLTRVLAEEEKKEKLPASIDGIKIVEMPVTRFGKHAQDTVGVHVLLIGPHEDELQSAVDAAKRDGYPTVYVYNQMPKAHLYMVKAIALVKAETSKGKK